MAAARRVGVIGFGAIGRSLALQLGAASDRSSTLAGVCVRAAQMDEARSRLPAGTMICERLDDLLESKPDVIIEAAGQRAVAECADAVLGAGLEFLVLSIGALADAGLRGRIEHLARLHGGAVAVPAGALAGFDGLRSLRHAGLSSVSYTSTKPPSAWKNTPAEKEFALGELTEATVLFRGNAAQAALAYPKNANLAAAVALAGIGFDETRVVLLADPTAAANTGKVVAVSAAATLHLTMEARAFGENPKTSEITAASVMSALDNATSVVRFV